MNGKAVAPDAAAPASLVGYRVDCSDGRLGVVEDVRSPLHDGDGAILLVSSGLFVRSRTVVPFASVTEIAASSRRIVVRSPGAEP